MSLSHDIEKNYVKSLSSAATWDAIGGKSGASFSRTADERFIVKCISRTELQMFLDCAPAYFEYLSKAFFHGLPTMLCKIVGVYQIGYHNRVTSKRTMEQVAVMQVSIFPDLILNVMKSNIPLPCCSILNPERIYFMVATFLECLI